MKALHLTTPPSPPSLIEGTAPVPRPGTGELLIRVCAAGVISTELSWYPTTHGKDGESRIGAIPAHEFSGTIEDVGEDIGRLEIGREVYGMNDWYSDGDLAEYCLAPFFAVYQKPSRLTHYEAASVPISALTAWQGLFDRARLRSGERVLVHGAAGGVGVFAVQLARLHGARVIATASARNRDFVLSLGAEQVIDYAASRFEDCVNGLDVVFDTVGADTLERSWGVLGPGGRLVTVVSTVEDSADARVKNAFFIVEPNQKQFAEVAALLDDGRLRTVVDTVVPLSQAPEIYTGKLHRKSRGKLVVAIENQNLPEGKI
ncbi:MAG: NADP-dependent oxidoreductase [Acidobacteriia bacterium]|nr:NADP-dependent oxidoreductase [Terriglobia bacterium]